MDRAAHDLRGKERNVIEVRTTTTPVITSGGEITTRVHQRFNIAEQSSTAKRTNQLRDHQRHIQSHNQSHNHYRNQNNPQTHSQNHYNHHQQNHQSFFTSPHKQSFHSTPGLKNPYPQFYNRPKRKLVSLHPTTTIDSTQDFVNSSNNTTFSLLCYNILAEAYARPRYYPWITSRRILSWRFRSEKLLTEILNYKADVICLQEVENTTFDWLRRELLIRGNYDEGHFLERTGWRIDGCAIFFRSEKFTCIGKMELLFNHFTDREDLKTDNVALLLALRFSSSSSSSTSPSASSETLPDTTTTSSPSSSSHAIIVGTTHLCFREAEARRLQAREFLRQSNNFRQQISKRFPDLHHDIGLTLSGDFNSGPSSWVYNLFSNGKNEKSHDDKDDDSDGDGVEEEEEEEDGDAQDDTHAMTSVYNHLLEWIKKGRRRSSPSSTSTSVSLSPYSLLSPTASPCKSENKPEENVRKNEKKYIWNSEAELNPSIGSKGFTCFTEKPSMIDYIWISRELQCEEVLDLPKNLLLPNEHLSSDHIALFTKLSVASASSSSGSASAASD